ncbi:hypothetical protein METBIDRAFT_31977 [Metschnikowia bicuspidata var. bicuspidata NRRL YB-4993]|uniref:Secreted protein n=1 Tax=Metschnikowia bicuspidata var. bicuspidata NRRL YB-4993 TaxID=869754 RepID=A0A1A0HBE7_9ASCO|nr:hypothetical protein METBIDRAFT_31977 [Metschnikowia bicuspidata var. bicuspidata NRRL YB-4993]OBA21459.1 hypothetical protein METBIDRAFT_31977 [Metschnikowia bicuspidata var. bicuspidata NRRL YB-4993]
MVILLGLVRESILQGLLALLLPEDAVCKCWQKRATGKCSNRRGSVISIFRLRGFNLQDASTASEGPQNSPHMEWL